ncbi:hypothetical protein [Zhihengliuella halotolerans]|uniref:hypothetical protein n=1 Tax=Zhihengliuella halotolerans TaxID=370736 RepID=UPI0015E08656|nr:hypothetical protein [Zhihengliuella halotolerans]
MARGRGMLILYLSAVVCHFLPSFAFAVIFYSGAVGSAALAALAQALTGAATLFAALTWSQSRGRWLLHSGFLTRLCAGAATALPFVLLFGFTSAFAVFLLLLLAALGAVGSALHLVVAPDREVAALLWPTRADSQE